MFMCAKVATFTKPGPPELCCTAVLGAGKCTEHQSESGVHCVIVQLNYMKMSLQSNGRYKQFQDNLIV